MRKYKKASWESNGSEERGEGGKEGLQSDVLHERRIKKNVKTKKE